MSVQPIGGSPAQRPDGPSCAPKSAQDKNPATEITTVTTHCDKEHKHTPSCPHTVSTRPAPQMGEPGYLMDEMA